MSKITDTLAIEEFEAAVRAHERMVQRPEQFTERQRAKIEQRLVAEREYIGDCLAETYYSDESE
jgi:hypothetical protein